MNLLEVNTDSLARRVAEGLRKIGIAIRSRAWKEAGKRRITPLQAQTLAVLRAQTEHAATISTLATELAVSLPTVSDMVRTLVDKGLVQKTRSGHDARVVTVRLSSKGKRAVGGARGRQDFLERAAQQLVPAEQELVLHVLMKIISTLHARGDVSTARMCVTCRFFRPNAHLGAKRLHHCDFFNEPFSGRFLRIECPAHQQAARAEASRNQKILTTTKP